MGWLKLGAGAGGGAAPKPIIGAAEGGEKPIPIMGYSGGGGAAAPGGGGAEKSQLED